MDVSLAEFQPSLAKTYAFVALGQAGFQYGKVRKQG